ncbi:MAG: hypothetical protein KDD63_12995, partial [Bacteroidetes bacterium]|nr:hypothetical protein [Bacteroidota bacterium]
MAVTIGNAKHSFDELAEGQFYGLGLAGIPFKGDGACVMGSKKRAEGNLTYTRMKIWLFPVFIFLYGVVQAQENQLISGQFDHATFSELIISIER